MRCPLLNFLRLLELEPNIVFLLVSSVLTDRVNSVKIVEIVNILSTIQYNTVKLTDWCIQSFKLPFRCLNALKVNPRVSATFTHRINPCLKVTFHVVSFD